MGAAAAVVGAVVIDTIAVDAALVGTLTAFEAVAAVGATLGAIGAITGNKDLALAGTALGVVGGVGALASSAGDLIDSASDFFGSSSSDAAVTAPADAPPDVPDVPPTETGTAPATAPADQALPGAATDTVTPPAEQPTNFVDALGKTSAPADPTAAIAQQTGAAEGQPTGLINQAGVVDPGSVTQSPTAVTNTTTGGTPTDTPGFGNQPQPTPAAVTGAPQAGGTVTGAPQAGDTVTGQPAPVTGSPDSTDLPPPPPERPDNLASNNDQTANQGVLSKVLSFAKNNQLITYGIMQAGGSLLSGLTNPLTPAQINALNAQAAANRAVAARTQQQTANMQGPGPKATMAPISGPGQPILTGPGMINQG